MRAAGLDRGPRGARPPSWTTSDLPAGDRLLHVHAARRLRARGLLVLARAAGRSCPSRAASSPSRARGSSSSPSPPSVKMSPSAHHRLAGLRDEHDARGVAVEPVRRRGLELGRRQVVGHAAGARAPSRRASRPSMPVPGCAASPAGLSTARRCVVLVEHPERRPRRARRARARRLGAARGAAPRRRGSTTASPSASDLLGAGRARRSRGPSACGTSCRRARAARRGAPCARACRAAGRRRRARP